MIYATLFVYLVGLSCIYELSERHRGRGGMHYMICIASLILVAGLRYRMAPDTIWYAFFFETEVEPLNRLNWSAFFGSRYQPLWILLNSFCKTFGNFYLLQFAVAIIHISTVGYFLAKSTNQKFIALTFYYILCYFYFNMDILREALAVSMFLLSVLNYTKGRFIRFLAYNVLAWLFHQYAAFAFFLPIILSKNIPRWSRISAILVAPFVIYVLSGGSSGLLIDYISRLMSESYNLGVELSGLGYTYNLCRILPCCIIIYFYRRREVWGMKFNKDILTSLVWCYIALVMIRVTSLPFVERISNYFVLFPVILIASTINEVFRNVLGRQFRLLAGIAMFLVSALFYTMPMFATRPTDDTRHYRRYYPYYTFISEKTDVEREQITRSEAKETY